MEEWTQNTDRPRLGRPPSASEIVRNKRVVTFVTKSELAKLESMIGLEGKSLSEVVHRILAGVLKTTSSSE